MGSECRDLKDPNGSLSIAQVYKLREGEVAQPRFRVIRLNQDSGMELSEDTNQLDEATRLVVETGRKAFERDLPELCRDHPGSVVVYHGEERLSFAHDVETAVTPLLMTGDYKL